MITTVAAWFLPKRWYFIGAFYAISLAGVFLWTWNWRDDACETKDLKAVVEGVEKHEKREKKIIRLDNAALRQRYCEWVRDDKQACLQADIPIP